jgi:hypothetical protein
MTTHSEAEVPEQLTPGPESEPQEPPRSGVLHFARMAGSD